MNTRLLLLIASALSLSACASANVFYQDHRGGILVVTGSEEGKMAAAREKIEAHCGPLGYTIVKRFTVVVGSESYSQTNYEDVSTEQSSQAQSSAAASEEERRRTNTGAKEASTSTETSASRGETNKVSTGEEVSVSRTTDLTEHRVAYRCGK